MKRYFIAFTFLLLVGGVLSGCTKTVTEHPAKPYCTQEVMECPDGSYVSRNPSNDCQFDPCPDNGEDDNVDEIFGTDDEVKPPTLPQ